MQKEANKTRPTFTWKALPSRPHVSHQHSVLSVLPTYLTRLSCFTTRQRPIRGTEQRGGYVFDEAMHFCTKGHVLLKKQTKTT